MSNASTINNNHFQNIISLRPFGNHINDIEIDFTQKNRPLLVTQIIECCTINKNKGFNQEFFWDLSIGKRIECLLVLVSQFEKSISFEMNCLNEECKKKN